MLTPQVISAVKKAFSRSKTAQEFRQKNVVEGMKGKRGGKIVQCNVCGSYLPLYKSQVDHVSPIVPVSIPGKHMSFIMIYERAFCDESNLQMICESCHKLKNQKETSERIKWRRKRKYLVCRSVHGGLIKVISITNMKEFDERWEIMDVKSLRKDADCTAKKLRRM